MAQVYSYPLPPLFLGEVLERGKADHTHVCDEHCASDWMVETCARSLADNEQLLDVPTIVKIEEGHGKHVHDDPEDVNGCGTGRCMRDCDNSDWVVTVCYSRRGWWATYGINRAEDVQDVSLWAN